jgi:hypothetical protein
VERVNRCVYPFDQRHLSILIMSTMGYSSCVRLAAHHISYVERRTKIYLLSLPSSHGFFNLIPCTYSTPVFGDLTSLFICINASQFSSNRARAGPAAGTRYEDACLKWAVCTSPSHRPELFNTFDYLAQISHWYCSMLLRSRQQATSECYLRPLSQVSK